MGSDACQETVRDPENNIELGGGGGRGEGNVMVCLFTSERAWKGNFVIDFVHVGLVAFQNFQQPESFHFPRAVFSRILGHEQFPVIYWRWMKEDSDRAFLL